MNRISLVHQEGTLKSYFPDSFVVRDGESELFWIGRIRPKPLCNQYTLMLHYVKGERVRVYVLNPKKLELAKGKTKLPHVWSTLHQQLCLFYPDGREYHDGMYWVQSVIPWASEWLYHYELWVATGEWYGGGIDHENAAEEEMPRKKINVKELVM